MLTADLLALKFKAEHIDSLLSMNFYNLTTDEIDKLSDRYLSLNDKLEYFKGTTPEVEYGIDLQKLYKLKMIGGSEKKPLSGLFYATSESGKLDSGGSEVSLLAIAMHTCPPWLNNLSKSSNEI